jgi:chemosensory pili system protein ChpA (sensor histidine kinase/response regulator)
LSCCCGARGTLLNLEVADDGAGLNFDAIRRKAVERGLMPQGLELADDEVARFIFESGFSTAARLTQNAGRGVGMDVVASEIKQLGGVLELRSEAGRGMRFIVRLPLTLALSQALMVGLSEETYALPLPAIEGIARIPRALAAQVSGDEPAYYGYGGQDYRIRSLAELLDLPYAVPEDSRSVLAVLVRLGEGIGGERRVALLVDRLLGNREIVSKAVGPQLSSISGVAGATIVSSGEVVLILDPAALVIDRARRRLIAEANVAREALEKQYEQVGRMVMVVDDSITMRRVAERLLVRNGYRVITAKDGIDAMAVLQHESPAVILLDIEMPRADGFEVASFVRADERIRDTPIIMITSRSGDKHRARAAALGVERYLIKPYQEDELLDEIRALLQWREASAA